MTKKGGNATLSPNYRRVADALRQGRTGSGHTRTGTGPAGEDLRGLPKEGRTFGENLYIPGLLPKFFNGKTHSTIDLPLGAQELH